MIAIVVLIILCTAGIDAGFGDFSHRLTYCFPGLQVVPVIAFGVGSRAFCLVMKVFHLELGFFPSDQRCCFTAPGSSIIISDSNSGLCRNKFDTKSRVVACWIKS